MSEQTKTFGESLVGISFNPSGDNSVSKVKELFSEIADIVYEQYSSSSIENKGLLEKTIFTNCIGEILNAQMNVVKFITLNK